MDAKIIELIGEKNKELAQKNSTEIKFIDGEYIFSEGDNANTVFLVESGRIDLIIKDESGEKFPFYEAKAGEIIGEDCIEGSRRIITALAVEDAVAHELKKDAFLQMLVNNVKLKESVIETHMTRVLEKAISLSPLFRPLPLDARRQLLQRFEPIVADTGFEIIKEGDLGDAMYIIKDGVVTVSTSNDGKEIWLAELGEGDFFGEVALVSNVRRTATVRTKVPTRLLKLTRGSFRQITDRFPEVLEIVNSWIERRVQDTISALVTDED